VADYRSNETIKINILRGDVLIVHALQLVTAHYTTRESTLHLAPTKTSYCKTWTWNPEVTPFKSCFTVISNHQPC